MIQTIFDISTEALLGWLMYGAGVFALLLVPLYLIREVRRTKKLVVFLVNLQLGRVSPVALPNSDRVTSLNRWKRKKNA